MKGHGGRIAYAFSVHKEVRICACECTHREANADAIDRIVGLCEMKTNALEILTISAGGPIIFSTRRLRACAYLIFLPRG